LCRCQLGSLVLTAVRCFEVGAARTVSKAALEARGLHERRGMGWYRTGVRDDGAFTKLVRCCRALRLASFRRITEAFSSAARGHCLSRKTVLGCVFRTGLCFPDWVVFSGLGCVFRTGLCFPDRPECPSDAGARSSKALCKRVSARSEACFRVPWGHQHGSCLQTFLRASRCLGYMSVYCNERYSKLLERIDRARPVVARGTL
jgi:hypothetical protein